jgi:Tol biopolymer transport system component
MVVALGMRYFTPTDRAVPVSALFVPKQFSSSPGLDVGASFSPDGNLIAYASDRGGSFEIFVKSFDAGARELQLTSDGNQNLYPAFSPDGRDIAFASTRRSGIHRVAAIGGAVERLTDFGVHPVWSPDGGTIVFRSSASASLSTTDYYWPAESSLWTVPVAGGEPKQITGNGKPAGGQSFPTWSPDGSEIRFVNHFKGEASIWAYRTADGSLRKLFGSTSFPYSNPIFSADGSRMWFVNWRLNGNIGIWKLALDTATLTPLGEPEPLYQSAFATPRDLTLSPDGSRLAFTAALSTSAILAKAADQNHNINNKDEPISLTKDTSYRYGLVRSSPDGTRVAYTSFPRNNPPDVWIANADGTEAFNVGKAGTARNYGTLNRDNSRVLLVEFLSPDATEDGPPLPGRQVVAQSLKDGSSRRFGELTPGANQVAFSSDGILAVYHDDFEERRQVYLQNVASGVRRVLTSGPEDIGFPRFSRNDEWISVEITHRTSGGSDLAILPATGGPLEVILRSDQPTFSAGWMPDNDRILFAGFRDAAWNVYSVSRLTKKIEQLTHYTSLRTYVRYPDWLAGDRIVYEFNETKGNIFVANLP